MRQTQTPTTKIFIADKEVVEVGKQLCILSENDLKVANSIKASFPGIAIFHLQQGVEKTIKSLGLLLDTTKLDALSKEVGHDSYKALTIKFEKLWNEVLERYDTIRQTGVKLEADVLSGGYTDGHALRSTTFGWRLETESARQRLLIADYLIKLSTIVSLREDLHEKSKEIQKAFAQANRLDRATMWEKTAELDSTYWPVSMCVDILLTPYYSDSIDDMVTKVRELTQWLKICLGHQDDTIQKLNENLDYVTNIQSLGGTPAPKSVGREFQIEMHLMFGMAYALPLALLTSWHETPPRYPHTPKDHYLWDHLLYTHDMPLVKHLDKLIEKGIETTKQVESAIALIQA